MPQRYNTVYKSQYSRLSIEDRQQDTIEVIIWKHLLVY
jgi:hypothetical protein